MDKASDYGRLFIFFFFFPSLSIACEIIYKCEVPTVQDTDNPGAFNMTYITTTCQPGPVAQWIRHLTTNQGIPGSNPGRVAFFSLSLSLSLCLSVLYLSVCLSVSLLLHMLSFINAKYLQQYKILTQIQPWCI